MGIPGHVEYDSQQLGKTAAIIVGVLLPLLVLLVCAAACIYRRAKGDHSSASWKYLGSDNTSISSLLRHKRPAPQKSPAPVVAIDKPEESPKKTESLLQTHADPKSNLQNKSPNKKKRMYDGVYFTNEPIPGMPPVNFEDKVWDLNEHDDINSTDTNSSYSNTVSRDHSSSVPDNKIARHGSIETEIF